MGCILAENARNAVQIYPKHKKTLNTNLILVNFAVLKLRFALLLKRDDNQGHENVNEEEWKYYEINDVEYGHFDTKVLDWTPVFICGGH